MSNTLEDVVVVLDEAVHEAVGTSHKKWALVVVAFVAGAAAAVWLIVRARSADAPVAPDTGETP